MLVPGGVPRSGPDENASELTRRASPELGAAALGTALDRAAIDGAHPAEPQPEEGVTYAAKLDKGEARLDFSRPARELHRQVRALHGWPVAETVLDEARVRVWRSRLPAREDAAGESADGRSVGASPAGTVLSANGDCLRVACGEGAIELLELQSPGRQAMPARAFAQGRELVGRRFAPPPVASPS